MTALVFYNNDTLFRRNNIEDKLRKYGIVTKKQVAATSGRSADPSTVDMVILIQDGVPEGHRKACESVATHAGKPFSVISHQQSHATWGNLIAMATQVRAIKEAARFPSLPQAPPSEVAPVASEPAQDEESMRIAEMYSNENDRLKAKLHDAGEALDDARAERDRLRVEKENAEACREQVDRALAAMQKGRADADARAEKAVKEAHESTRALRGAKSEIEELKKEVAEATVLRGVAEKKAREMERRPKEIAAVPLKASGLEVSMRALDGAVKAEVMTRDEAWDRAMAKLEKGVS